MSHSTTGELHNKHSKVWIVSYIINTQKFGEKKKTITERRQSPEKTLHTEFPNKKGYQKSTQTKDTEGEVSTKLPSLNFKKIKKKGCNYERRQRRLYPHL